MLQLRPLPHHLQLHKEPDAMLQDLDCRPCILTRMYLKRTFHAVIGVERVSSHTHTHTHTHKHTHTHIHTHMHTRTHTHHDRFFHFLALHHLYNFTIDSWLSCFKHKPQDPEFATSIEDIDVKLMKEKLRVHFMNPFQKWNYDKHRRFPWRLVVQLLTIILVTVQVNKSCLIKGYI